MITLDQLLRDEEKLEYLSLDTEGSELAILSAYSWAIKPRLVTVEFRYDGEVLRALRRMFEPRGYTLMELRGFDACFELDQSISHYRNDERPTQPGGV